MVVLAPTIEIALHNFIQWVTSERAITEKDARRYVKSIKKLSEYPPLYVQPSGDSAAGNS